MIILFGGFLGSGRRMLAQAVAKKLGYHYYDIESKMMHTLEFNDRREVREVVVRPATDQERIRLFDRILADLPILLTMHGNILLDYSFHRAVPREHFFNGVRRLDTLTFVWIDTDEANIEAKFGHMLQKRMIPSIEYARKRRERAKASFQPFSEQPTTFVAGAVGSRAADVENLIRLLTQAK